jgi:hypoxanthine phosphoribosyltransferase
MEMIVMAKAPVKNNTSIRNAEIVFTEKQIAKRVGEMAKLIAADYAEKHPYVIVVLKGAFIFASDLIRQMDIPLEIDFMAIESYGNSTKSSGIVRITKDLDANIESRHVLVVEDIVDSGRTLSYLLDSLAARRAASIKVATLFDRPDRREVDVEIDYKGFDIPDKFVLGYGMDYSQHYRDLPYVFTLDYFPDEHEMIARR